MTTPAQEKVTVPPVMDLATLFWLLAIAEKPDCRFVRWQPMPDREHGLEWEVQNVSLNELCKRARSYVGRIEEYRDAACKAALEREEWKAAFERRQERIAWLENQCAMHEIADHDPNEQ